MNTITIDETSFVEAQEPNKTLLFPTETKQQPRFELGVSMWIHKWEILCTAVEHSWGGPESADKRDWITKLVVDLFRENKVVDVLQIEETLLYAMLDEFDVDIQDDSALPIAMNILKCWEYVNRGGFNDIQNMYLEWKHKKENGIKEHSHEVHINEDPLNPNDSSDESEEFSDDDDMEVEEEHTHNEPIIDDDGFEMVQPKGKHRH
ncbi:unnamed protein product [Hanseniaspora opuntiae]